MNILIDSITGPTIQTRLKDQALGYWNNDIIYARLAPAVLEELRRLTPRDEKGLLKNKLFQLLTDALAAQNSRITSEKCSHS